MRTIQVFLKILSKAAQFNKKKSMPIDEDIDEAVEPSSQIDDDESAAGYSEKELQIFYHWRYSTLQQEGIGFIHEEQGRAQRATNI